MSKRFVVTLLTLVVIGLATFGAVYFAKGYRLSTDSGQIFGTGILSVISVPDQASVYLDGHLTTATNENINSLPPKKYQVRIVKEGFIPWEKEVEVKEGLVTEVKATLFRSLPSIYPLTYSGAEKVLLSHDSQKLAFVVPINTQAQFGDKRAGVWVWQMSEKPIAFNRGAEPHQIAQSLQNLDYSKAEFRFSPDSNQILVSFPDRHLLLDTDRFNDPPKDITAVVNPTTKAWDSDQRDKELVRTQLIKDPLLKKTASASAFLKWSPDETKILYSQDGKKEFKVTDLEKNKTYDLQTIAQYNWLPDSEHIILVESVEKEKSAKISIIEFDGANKSEIFAGEFNKGLVFAWPDSSRLVIVSSFPTATASQPNLYGINLK